MEMTLLHRTWWKNVLLPFSKPLGKLFRTLFPVSRPLHLSHNFRRITKSSTLQPYNLLLVLPLTKVILPNPNHMNLVWQDQSAWEWIHKLRQNVSQTNLLPSCRSLPLMRMKNSNESRKMDNYVSLNHLRLVKKGTLQLGFRHSTCSWQYTAEIIHLKTYLQIIQETRGEDAALDYD